MNQPILPTLGRRVADCRDRLGWTQKKLAEEAEISVTFLSEVENDRRTPGADVLLRLANALGASLDYLLKGSLDSAPPARSLVLPKELVEVAEEEGWSMSELKELLAYRQMVVARRSRGEGASGERTLTRDEWRRLHTWLREAPF